MPNPQIDPELEYILEQSSETDLIDVALLLHNSDATPANPQALLERLQLSTNPDIQTSFLPKANVLSVRAPVTIIRLLVIQPEIELASAAVAEE